MESEVSSVSISAAMGSGETNEMRKNRQKPESKMRMRRKGDSQLAALTVYARLAGAHVIRASTSESMVPDMLGRWMADVFVQHGEHWNTLIALEKRLFHTIRTKLGLQELVVRKLVHALSSCVLV